jgi:hypothetical protein
MTEDDKLLCSECHKRLRVAEILHAISPFDAGDDIAGCPQCKAINAELPVCDEPGCWELVTQGCPTTDGYRTTCREHRYKDSPRSP